MYKRWKTGLWTPFWQYKWKTGMVSWALHRITGLALTFYLCLHIWVVSTLHSEQIFNTTMRFLTTPVFKLAEVGLLGCILFHTFNGIRILFVDFGKGAYYHEKLFWGLTAVGFILWAIGSYVILMHAFGH